MITYTIIKHGLLTIVGQTLLILPAFSIRAMATVGHVQDVGPPEVLGTDC